MQKHNHLFYEFVVREKYKGTGLNIAYLGYDKEYYNTGVSIRMTSSGTVRNILFEYEILEKYELLYRVEKINKIKECIRLKK